MGEKGIAADLPGAAASQSLIERTTTTVTSTVTGATEDIVDKVRDKGIESAADLVVDEVRERAARDEGAAGETST